MYGLRAAESGDFEFLLGLKAAYRPYVEAVFGSWDPQAQRARFARAFSQSQAQVVVVEGEAVGSLDVRWDEDPVFLAGIELTPAVQGRGLGTRIVHDVLRRAASQGRAVRLQVLRPNPARRLYARLGFEVVEQTASHLQMRWTATDATEAALQRAMQPWSDPQRRDAWLYDLFDSPPDRHVAFAQFVAHRQGLPETLCVADVGCGTGRMLRPLAALGWTVVGYEPHPGFAAAAQRVAEVAGERVTVRRGGFADIDDAARFDLIVAFNGPLAYLHTHAQRCDAAARIAAALRPGGVFVLDAPNMPWILRHYRAPTPQTVVWHDATISRIVEHDIDYHRGILHHDDLFAVELHGAEVAAVHQHHHLSLCGFPEYRAALQGAGLTDIEAFADLDAVDPSRVQRNRIIATAKRP